MPVTASQAAVYEALSTIEDGLPDHALVPLAQHVVGIRLSSSGIRTRRKELTDLDLVADTGNRVKTGSGRSAVIWEAV